MSRFDGKVAIITGGASGIGKEIALRYAAAGGTPVIADLNLNAADATAREIKAKGSDAFAVGMNVVDEDAVERVLPIQWPNTAASMCWSATPGSRSSSRSWISRSRTGSACWRSISTALF